MAATFSQIKTGLDDIAARIRTNRARVADARSTLVATVDDLTAMEAQYTQFIADVNAALAAEPTNDALKTAKAEKDKLVAEFSALRTAATTGRDAIQA